MPDVFGFLWGIVGIIVLVPVAFYVFRYGMRRLDSTLGVKFKEIHEKISADPMALAVYYSARLIALAIIVSALFGKWV